MNPVLFEIPWFGGTLPYHSYGFCLALAFLLGMSLVVRMGRREGLRSDQMVTLVFIGVVGSLAGSRLLHLLMAEPAMFFANPGIFFDFSRGGYAFYGGFLGMCLVALVYTRIKGLNYLHISDLYAVAVVFGLAFGRTGCLLAGCCHGRPIEHPLPDWLAGVLPFQWPSWFALTFPTEAGGLGSLLDQPLVPTQPMSGLYSLAIFLFLALWVAPRKRYHGQVFVWVCILYAAARSTVELFRGDERGLYFNDALSTSQLVSVPIVLMGVGILLWARSRMASGKLEPLAADWRALAAKALPPHERGTSSSDSRAKQRRKKKKKRS